MSREPQVCAQDGHTFEHAPLRQTHICKHCGGVKPRPPEYAVVPYLAQGAAGPTTYIVKRRTYRWWWRNNGWFESTSQIVGEPYETFEAARAQADRLNGAAK